MRHIKNTYIIWSIILLGLATGFACALAPSSEDGFINNLIIYTQTVVITQEATTSEPTQTTTTQTNSSLESSDSISSTMPTDSTETSSTMSVIPGVPPSSPTTFEATGLDIGEAILLTWDLPLNSTASRLELRVSALAFSEPPDPSEGSLLTTINLADSAVDSFTHLGVTNGNTLYYAIFLVDELNQYSEGLSTSMIPWDYQPPASVSNLQVDDTTAGTIELSWTNPPDEDFAGVCIRRSTNTYPNSITDGSAVATGTGNGCGESNGCIAGTANETQSFADAVNNGTYYYYTVFSYDDDCNYTTSKASIAGAAPLEPIYNLQVFPGEERLFLRWLNADSNTDRFHIRYNTDPSTPIQTNTDGFPVTTVENPTEPGYVEDYLTMIEHHTDTSGNPLEASPTEYQYAVFAVSADGIMSSPVTIVGSIPATISTLVSDGFEGAGFCSTWDVKDHDGRGSANCSDYNMYEFWGPVETTDRAFEGNYAAFSAALRYSSNDCAAAYATGWTTYTRECSNTMMAQSLGDLTGYDRIFLAFRYNVYTHNNCDGCFESSCGQWWHGGRVYISMGGGPPDGDEYRLSNKDYYSMGSWSNWRLEVVDISAYKSLDTWFGFQWWTRCDGDCNCDDYSYSGFYIDTVQVYAY
jgi:hypothetical protein